MIFKENKLKNNKNSLPFNDRFYYCITIIQLVMAVVWLFLSHSEIGYTPESDVFLNAAHNLKFDEYTGLLYPVLLSIVYSLVPQKVASCIIYFIQFIVLMISILFLLGKMEKRKISGVIYILSFPFTMQEIFLISPICLSTAVFIWFYALVLSEDYKNKDIDLMFPFVLGAMLSRHLFYAMIMVWIMNILVTLSSYKLRKDYENKARAAVSSAIHLILIIAVSVAAEGMFISHNEYNKMPASLGTAFMSNLAFEHFEEDYYFWPEEVKAAVPFEELSEIVKSREYGTSKFGNIMSQKFSYEEMKKYAWKIGFASVFNRSKDTIITVLKETAGYFFMPFTLVVNLCGIGKSMTGYRMMYFSSNNPILSMLYMYVGFIMLAMYIIVICLHNMNHKKSVSAVDRRMVTRTVISWTLLSVFWGIFSDNYFDYFKMVPFYFIWVAASIPISVNKTNETNVTEESK